MTTDPVNPAPMPPAPPPTSGGATMNPNYVYRCEICGDQVDVDPAHLPTGRWGIIVRCDQHPTHRKARPAPPPTTPTPASATATRHPLAGTEATHVMPPRHLPSRAAFNLTPAERQDYGVTVTTRHSGTGSLVTLVGKGPVFDALADVIERIDEMNDDWQEPWFIVSVSSPGLIYSDLQGMRDPGNQPPEVAYLARLGRLDLLAP